MSLPSASTSHLVAVPALLRDIVRGCLELADEDAHRQAIVEGFNADQIRAALKEAHAGRYEWHLGEIERLRREAREAGR